MRKKKKLSKKAILGICLLMVGSVTALWLSSGWLGNSTAEITGVELLPMVEVVTLDNFGALDFSNPETSLTQVKTFVVESPYGAKEKFYTASWVVNIEELNSENCLLEENDIYFELWKVNGYGTTGEIENGASFVTAENSNSGASTYELRLIASTRALCPANYEVEITFAE